MAVDADTARGLKEGVKPEIFADADQGHSRRMTLDPVSLATGLGVLAIIAISTLAGWLGLRTQRAEAATTQRNAYVEVAEQAAINLTSIDYTRADDDVKRILDSATGVFYDDFSKRAQPFVDVVKQVQSKSQGSVTGAGVESQSSDGADVLVSVSVKTESSAGPPEQAPRLWRMRLTVQKVAEEIKVANVSFVP